MQQTLVRFQNALARAILIVVPIAASYSATAFADVPYLADTSTKSIPAAQFASVLAGILAVAVLASWFFKRKAGGDKPRALLISSVALFVVAIALPQVAVYQEHFPLVVATRTLHRGDVIKTEDVKLTEATNGQALNGTISKLDDAVGKVMMHKIKAGEPVKMGRPWEIVVASKDLPAGHIATADEFEEKTRFEFTGPIGYPVSSRSMVVGMKLKRAFKAGDLVLIGSVAPPSYDTPAEKKRLREETEQSIASLSDSIKKTGDVDSYRARANHYRNIGKFDLALADMDSYLSKSKDLTSSAKQEALRNRSDVLFYLGRYADSINALADYPPTDEKGLNDNDQVELKMRSGRAKLALGQTEAALADLDAAHDAEYSDELPELLYLRALAHERLGKTDVAAADRAKLELIAYQPEPESAKQFAVKTATKAK